MKQDFAEIDIVSSIDLTDIKSRLEGIVLEAFEDSGREMLKAIKDQWVGWKYVGRDMATVGESRRKWDHSIQATEGIRTIEFTNLARHWETNKFYAAEVSRRRGATPEWMIARDNLIANYLPRMIEKITDALKNSLSSGKPVKLRENKNLGYREAIIEA